MLSVVCSYLSVPSIIARQIRNNSQSHVFYTNVLMFKVYVGKIKRTDSCTFFQVGKQNVVLDLVIDIMGGFVSAFLYFGYNGVQ